MHTIVFDIDVIATILPADFQPEFYRLADVISRGFSLFIINLDMPGGSYIESKYSREGGMGGERARSAQFGVLMSLKGGCVQHTGA